MRAGGTLTRVGQRYILISCLWAEISPTVPVFQIFDFQWSKIEFKAKICPFLVKIRLYRLYLYLPRGSYINKTVSLIIFFFVNSDIPGWQERLKTFLKLKFLKKYAS